MKNRDKSRFLSRTSFNCIKRNIDIELKMKFARGNLCDRKMTGGCGYDVLKIEINK